MSRLFNLRRAAFLAKDFLRGGPVMRHLADLERMDALGSDEERAESRRRADAIAAYAAKAVPRYRNLVPENARLEDFPVVDKTTLRERQDEFIARGMRRENMRHMLTSGSTGTPFGSYQDRGKRDRAEADIIHWGKMAGYHMGERLFYLRVWTRAVKRSRLGAYLSNIESLDVTSLSDESLDAILDAVLGHRGDYSLLGYVSSFEAISRRMTADARKAGVNGPKGILTMSETLDDGLRARLREQFGVWPAARYSNMENGLVAQQPMGPESHFVLNHGSFYLEILDQASDRQLPEGELGRIVITDLFNRGMPFVRYDTGDLGALSRDAEGRLVLGKVEGRRMDQIFDTRGRQVSPVIVANHMWSFPEVLQYQFIQRGQGDYLFKINLPGGFRRQDELLDTFKAILGSDAKMAVEMVDEIPMLSSGKRKKVVNELTRGNCQG